MDRTTPLFFFFYFDKLFQYGIIPYHNKWQLPFKSLEKFKRKRCGRVQTDVIKSDWVTHQICTYGPKQSSPASKRGAWSGPENHLWSLQFRSWMDKWSQPHYLLRQSWGAVNTCKKKSAEILTSARDWQLLVNLKQQLKFSIHVAATTLWTNIVFVSESNRKIVLLELTVSWEDCLDEAKESVWCWGGVYDAERSKTPRNITEDMSSSIRWFMHTMFHAFSVSLGCLSRYKRKDLSLLPFQQL